MVPSRNKQAIPVRIGAGVISAPSRPKATPLRTRGPGDRLDLPPLPVQALTNLKQSLRHHLAPSLILFSAALLVLAPSLPHFWQRPLGNNRMHPIDSSWLYFLTQKAFWSWPPSKTSQLYGFPDGFEFFTGLQGYADIGNPILASPLTAALGPVPAYNLHNLGMTCAAGLAAYALAWLLLRQRAAATVAGLLYLCMDPLLFALQWGEDDVATLWLLPAFLAVALASLRARPVAGLAAGAALGLVGWFNHYYLFFNAMVAGLLFCGLLLQGRQFWAQRKRWALYGCGFGAGLALVYGPRALLGVRASRVGFTEHTSDAITSLADLGRVSPRFVLDSSIDLSALFNPLSPTRLGAVQEQFIEGTPYLGLLALALAVIGYLGARPPHRRLLLAIGLLALVLSLGTYLKLERQLVLWGEQRPVPMPHGLLAHFVPFLSRINHPYRFATLCFMVVAVLAGGGTAVLARRLARRPAARLGLVALLCAACVGERLLCSPGLAPIRSSPAPYPAGLSQLDLPPERPALLHLPWPTTYDPHDNEGTRYQRWAQIAAHQRPMVTQVNNRWLLSPVSSQEMRCRLALLAAEGVGAVALSSDLVQQAPLFGGSPDHIAAYARDQVAQVGDNLQQVLAPASSEQALELYLLPAPESLLPQWRDSCRNLPPPHQQRPRGPALAPSLPTGASGRSPLGRPGAP